MASIRSNRIRVRIKNFFRGLATFAFMVGVLLIIILLHEPPKKYVGTIIEVSIWNGNAKLKTSSKSGKDTIIEVHKQSHESFKVGQHITVWTNDDLFTGATTTKPKN